MAISTVTPVAIQQALVNAQRRGGLGDYYGIDQATQALTRALAGNNLYLQGLNDTAKSNAQTDAALSSGYYGLNQDLINQQLKNHIYDAKHLETHRNAMQEAFNAARAQGLTDVSRPEFKLFVQNYLSQHGDYQDALAGMQQATGAMKQMRNQAFATNYVKTALEKQLVFEMAKKKILASDLNMNELTPDNQSRIWQQAVREAKSDIDKYQVKVEALPDGTYKAVSGIDGQEFPIPPEMTASAIAIAGGEKSPYDVLSALGKNEQAALKALQPPKPSAVPTRSDPRLADISRTINAQLAHIRALQKDNEGGKNDAEIADAKAEVKRYTQLHDSLLGIPAPTAAATPDLNSVVTKAAGLNTADTQIPAGIRTGPQASDADVWGAIPTDPNAPDMYSGTTMQPPAQAPASPSLFQLLLGNPELNQSTATSTVGE